MSKTQHSRFITINPLEQVTKYKYFGVIITSTLSWSTHISSISTKARRLVGMLYRHFYPWSSSEALLHKLYIALIHPCLEYAAPVWSPHHSKDINKLEAVQKFALRTCSKDWGANYSHLLSQYQLPNLDAHRQYLSLSHLFKIVWGCCIFPNAPVSKYSNAYSTRSQEARHLAQQYARTDVLYYSFFPRTISQWNSLPYEITSSSSLLSFKRNYWSHVDHITHNY